MPIFMLFMCGKQEIAMRPILIGNGVEVILASIASLLKRDDEKSEKTTGALDRDRLLELEQEKKTPLRQKLDWVISLCPLFCCALALMEYLLIPDKLKNAEPERYVLLLLIPAGIYAVNWIVARIAFRRGSKKKYWKLLDKAPLWSVIYLLLLLLDWLTLKTGKLLYPFIPWVNDIINAAIADWPSLLKSTLFSLRLLLVGYFCGVVLGLLTGITCGYSKRVRYWINPIIKVLGPIPTATWLPLIMLLATSRFAGSVFIIALGTWFSVTVASMTGISNVDQDYFDAARILGAKNRQLIFQVAIPSAMPNILQGMTQGMSSACISLMVAEMMGVEAGLGWYITWAKAWAMYNRMFAAIVVLCLIFNGVTKALDMVRKHALRWQKGVAKQ